jgi:preprotein translocase subunit SecG
MVNFLIQFYIVACVLLLFLLIISNYKDEELK